jgi:hypothetical protein
MVTAPLSDELLRETVEVYEACGRNAAEVARRTNVPGTTIKSRLHEAARRGLLGTAPVLPGYRLSQVSTIVDADGVKVREYIQQRPAVEGVFTMPEGHTIKGVSSYLDGQGNVVGQWVKTKAGELDPLAVVEAIKAALADYERPGPPTSFDAVPDDELLTIYPCGDWHLGLHVWGREAEDDWDLKIAERVIGKAMQDVISRSPSAATAVILLGGDTLHADNSNNQTPRSGNALDVDGRYQKVIGTTCRLLVNVIEWALARHEHVVVRILRGNHDDHACVAVQYHLAGWFRSEPRVTVDLDPSLYWWHRFGSVLLGSTHGHEASPKDMPGIMASRRAEDWGATRHRYVHTFHLHRSEKTTSTNSGVVCEIHETPIPKDGWAYGKGFLSGRSVKSITYHREQGEKTRCVEAIMDG